MKGHGSVSAWCIDHPVATILLTFALVLLGADRLPAPADRAAAGSRIPDHSGGCAIAWRQPGNHGVVGGHAA